MKIKTLLLEYVTKEIFNDFFAILYAKNLLPSNAKKYFEIELESYPNAYKYFNILPFEMAKNIFDDIEHPILAEFLHFFVVTNFYLLARKNKEDENIKPLLLLKNAYANILNIINFNKIIEFEYLKRKNKVKDLTLNRLVGETGLQEEQILNLIISNFLDHKKQSLENTNYASLLKTLHFHDEDPLDNYKPLRNLKWEKNFGGDGWAAFAYILKRLYKFKTNKEVSNDKWEQITLLVNALNMIQHNSGFILSKLQYFDDVWKTGINIKSFAKGIKDFEPLSDKAQTIISCVEKAIIEYNKENKGFNRINLQTLYGFGDIKKVTNFITNSIENSFDPININNINRESEETQWLFKNLPIITTKIILTYHDKPTEEIYNKILQQINNVSNWLGDAKYILDRTIEDIRFNIEKQTKQKISLSSVKETFINKILEIIDKAKEMLHN